MLKRSRWLLLKRPEKLTGEQRGRLAELVRRNLRTVRAYLLKEDFQSLWGYVSPYWAGQFLDRWCTRTMRSRLDPMKEVARMVALAPRPDSELVPSPGAVLQWRCRRLQRKGQSDHQTGVWVPHLRGTGSRFVSRTWRPARTKTHPQILLTRRYFEGVSSERGIAWRVADSLSLRSFLDLDMTEAAPDHSTLSRTRRRIDVETHEAVFTWVLERVAEAGLVRGKTVGIDATTLEANAAMRSIERRDTGESYEAFIRRLAEASGVETPTRADLARFDRSRKNKKTSNKEWQSPQDPDAKVAKMKDGRTHLAHKAEHGVDMDTGAIVSVTVQDASEGDSATLPETLTMAGEQVELVQPDGPGVEEVVADKGYHSDKTLVALDEIGIRSYVSEPERGQRCWQDKKTGETPPEKRAAQRALYGNRRRIRGARGRRLQRGRSELVERPFAHQYETGGLRRVWVRGHDNVRKRVLIQAAGCNIGLLLRRLTGVGTPRSLQGRALSAIYGLIGRLIDRWGRLTSPWGSKWRPAAFVGSIAHRQAA